MRIFKNKIIFFVFFSEACAAGGYHRSPTDLALLPAGQWVRRTNLPSAADFQFTDLHRFLCGLCGRGQEGHADDADFFFHYTLSADETYSVRLRRFSRLHCSPLGKSFFDTPVPLCEEGVLIPLPSPSIVFTPPSVPLVGDRNPYHKGKGCSWRCYSSARVLVSQRSLCPKGLAESAYAIKLRLFVA